MTEYSEQWDYRESIEGQIEERQLGFSEAAFKAIAQSPDKIMDVLQMLYKQAFDDGMHLANTLRDEGIVAGLVGDDLIGGEDDNV